MLLQTISVLLPLTAAALLQPQARKEAEIAQRGTPNKLFAYGPGISGAEVFAMDDGKLVLSLDETQPAKSKPIDWDLPPKGHSVTSTNNGGGGGVTGAGITGNGNKFYIAQGGPFAECGLIAAGTADPPVSIIDSFALIGTQIFVVNGKGYQSRFSVRKHDAGGNTLDLGWNVDGKKHDGLTPIELKTAAPAKFEML